MTFGQFSTSQNLVEMIIFAPFKCQVCKGPLGPMPEPSTCGLQWEAGAAQPQRVPVRACLTMLAWLVLGPRSQRVPMCQSCPLCPCPPMLTTSLALLPANLQTSGNQIALRRPNPGAP